MNREVQVPVQFRPRAVTALPFQADAHALGDSWWDRHIQRTAYGDDAAATTFRARVGRTDYASVAAPLLARDHPGAVTVVALVGRGEVEPTLGAMHRVLRIDFHFRLQIGSAASAPRTESLIEVVAVAIRGGTSTTAAASGKKALEEVAEAAAGATRVASVSARERPAGPRVTPIDFVLWSSALPIRAKLVVLLPLLGVPRLPGRPRWLP